MLQKEYIFGLVLVIILIAILFQYKEHATNVNCQTCPKCGAGMIRPNVTSRNGCDSPKCRCIQDIQATNTEYYQLDCSSCPKCNKGMGRPNKKVWTTQSLGCKDKRCKCFY